MVFKMKQQLTEAAIEAILAGDYTLYFQKPQDTYDFTHFIEYLEKYLKSSSGTLGI